MLFAPTSAQTETTIPPAAYALETLIQYRDVIAEFYPDYKLTLSLIDKTIDATKQQIDPNYVSTTVDRENFIPCL
jgi:hypothetical protein